ncbi:Uncharacterised protein [Canicola haemoglobinophilus]|nr:hypothetical protein [Canicola haemoglobinophilus]STO53429.1 Uncharacterised protein [Canicola haemoglobinophilus]
MTEFKQIIGRGTRLRPDAGKEFFTIMDFRGVTDLFADPDFDGEPLVIIDPDIEKPSPNKGDENSTIQIMEIQLMNQLRFTSQSSLLKRAS